MAVVEGKIFFKLKTKFCFYLQPNYPPPRTAIEAESAVLHFVFFIVIVNKMQQSAKSITIRIARNTLPEVFPLTVGSGKTMPFEKRLLTGAHPCTPVNDEICGINKSRFCSVSRTSVSGLKLQGDSRKLTAGVSMIR